MVRSADYKSGYAKGYATGRRSLDEIQEKTSKRVDAAIARAERAEAKQGLGKCGDCKYWRRGESGYRHDSVRWGECTPPGAVHANGHPIWFGNGDNNHPITTSDHFGCVMFERRVRYGND